MRTFRLFLLAVCAAGATVSCMTVARQIPPSTELFDSTVDTAVPQPEPLLPPEAPQPVVANTAPDSPSPAPVLMDVGPIPAVEDTSLAEADEPPQVADDTPLAFEAPVAPTPRPTGVMDESLLIVPPPVGTAYSLAVPVIPSTSVPSPRAPQQAPTQSVPPKPKPAAMAPAATAPAPAAAAQAPSAVPAPSAVAGSSSPGAVSAGPGNPGAFCASSGKPAHWHFRNPARWQ